MQKRRKPLLVISGPSGAGKGTLCQKLLAHYPKLQRSISVTSRAMRPGEQDEVDYLFLSAAEFEDHIRRDDFIEWVRYNQDYYGTPKTRLVEALKEPNATVLLEIDPAGALRLRELFGMDALLVFIMPPSLTVLRQRLIDRQTNSPADIDRRLAIAETELSMARQFDVVIENNQLETCWQTLLQELAVYDWSALC